jgi:DNA repair protein RadC
MNEKDMKALSPLIGPRAAAEALSRHTLSDLLCLDRRSLLRMAHIGSKKAEIILALPGLLERVSTLPADGSSVSCSKDVYDLFHQRLGRHPREHFITLALNSRNIILAEEVCAVGTVNTVHVAPSEVLKQAVLRSAASIICLHNHPSGDPTPSPEDRSLTDRISRAASLMGVRMLDHIIIASNSYYSFSDAGGL